MASDHATSSTARTPQPKRVLSCVRCQHRKIKCDRVFPCAHCVHDQAQCVQASQRPRQRRRQAPPDKLLDRLHRYEQLLRENNVEFDSVQKGLPGTSQSALDASSYGSDDADAPSPSATNRSEGMPTAKSFWGAMRQTFQDEHDDTDTSHEDVEVVAKKAWDQTCFNDDPLIFGSSQRFVELSTLHPEPVEIFKLWQLYIDNVNPLQRVIHIPTMQARIIEAVSNMSNINPIMEALMFSIYSMAVLSISSMGSPTMGSSTKDDLLSKYQFGCQQALLKCGFLRCNDRDCLTALYLYMLSVSTSTNPRALCSLLGLAIRIAQRMGIDSETANSKFDVLEAEMRRRLWWSLALFDTRICQLADYRTQTLSPLWDCATPLNVNDTDLRTEMKQPPASLEQPSEAIFVVVRGELGDFARNSAFHLDTTTPNLRSVARNFPDRPATASEEAEYLEKMIEKKYIRICNPQHPLHFMTIWESRRYLATFHLMEFYTKFANSGNSNTEVNPSAGAIYAISVLEADTNIMSSPLTTPYRWMMPLHFPFPAYVALTKELGARPTSVTADKAWEAMSDNCEARFCSTFQAGGPMLKMLTTIVLRAWSARQKVSAPFADALSPPRIVSRLKHATEASSEDARIVGGSGSDGTVGDVSNFTTPMPLELGGNGIFPETYGFDVPTAWGDQGNQHNWATFDWGTGQ